VEVDDTVPERIRRVHGHASLVPLSVGANQKKTAGSHDPAVCCASATKFHGKPWTVADDQSWR